MQEAGTDLHRPESNLHVNKLYNWRKQQQEGKNNKLKQKTHTANRKWSWLLPESHSGAHQLTTLPRVPEVAMPARLHSGRKVQLFSP